EVVQLRAADVATRGDLDLVDDGGVHREGALHADAEGGLADGEGLPDATAVAADDDALEDLDAGAAPLDDLDVHLDGVDRPDVGHVVPHGRVVDLVETLPGVVACCDRHRSSAVVSSVEVSRSPPRAGRSPGGDVGPALPLWQGRCRERDVRLCQREPVTRNRPADATEAPRAATPPAEDPSAGEGSTTGRVVGALLTLALLAPAAAILVSRVRALATIEDTGSGAGCTGVDTLGPILQAGLPTIAFLLALPVALLSLGHRARGWIWLLGALVITLAVEVALRSWLPNCL